MRAIGLAYRTVGLLAAGLFGLAACTTVGSQLDPGEDGQTRSGLQYYLPKKLVSLSLFKSPEGFPFPRYSERVIGDQDFSYLATIHRAAGADNTIGLGVDPQTRLLNSQTSTESQARGLDIAESLARSVTALESGGRFGRRDAEVFIGKVVFDPLDPAQVQAATDSLTRSFNAFVDQDCTAFLDDVASGDVPLEYDGVPDPYNIELVRQCEFFLTLVDRPGSLRILVSADPGGVPGQTGRLVSGPPALAPERYRGACSGGLCYRATAPYRFTVQVADRAILDDIIHLPNNQPPRVLRQPAGMFANQATTIGWVDGTPQQVTAVRNSELAGFVRLPATVVAALSEAVVAGFRRDAAEIDAETERLRAEAALIRQRLALRDTEEESLLAEDDRADRMEARADRLAAEADADAAEQAGSGDPLSVTPEGRPPTGSAATGSVPF